jgi:serine/threonine protein kinase
VRSIENSGAIMADERHCNGCGGMVPGDAPQGLCPQCLMKLGLPSGVEAQRPGSPDDQSPIPTSATPPGGFVPPEPSELADKFPQLEILELLGQGGMGAVYKARQKQLDRLVALKILPPEVGQDPAFAERFSREARSLAKLNHPRIVSVFDFGHTKDGLYYFIMEFVDGTDLRHVIEGSQLEPNEALAIVPQICEALQYAHEEGLVHRDIKPENILLDKKGRVKIADFGLAKLLGRPASDYTLTQAGQRMGTPHYMAPEQIDGAGKVDHRADIYSLGVVFYEMLTGQLPIGRFAPPSQKVQVDVRLDSVVLKSLEYEPELRYQNVSEVKIDVETICADGSGGDVGEPKPEPGPVSLLISSEDVYWVFGEAYGILRLEGSGLTLEYQVEDGIVGILRSGVKKARIPLAEISSILVEQGLRRTRLTIQASTWSAMKGVPAARAGQAKFYVSAKENASLTPFVEMLKRKLPDGTVSGFRKPGSDKAGAIEQPIHWPARAMLLGGLVVLAAGPLTAIPILVESSVVGRWEAADWSVKTILLTILLVAQALAVPVGGLVIAAAMNMKRRQGYGLAVAGGILLLLPLTAGSLVGIPLGICVLVALNSDEVKALFQRETGGLSRPGRWNGFCIASFLTSLVAGFMSLIWSRRSIPQVAMIVWGATIVLSMMLAVIGLSQQPKRRGMHGMIFGIIALVVALAALVSLFVTIYTIYHLQGL